VDDGVSQGWPSKRVAAAARVATPVLSWGRVWKGGRSGTQTDSRDDGG